MMSHMVSKSQNSGGFFGTDRENYLITKNIPSDYLTYL